MSLFTKTATVFTVTDSPVMDKNTKFLTYTLTEGDAREYIRVKEICNNFNHFSSWCDVHGKEKLKDDPGTQEDYINKVLSDEVSSYYIYKQKIPVSLLLAAFRLQSGCVPLGCSYESSVEVNLVLKAINQINSSTVVTAVKNNKTD